MVIAAAVFWYVAGPTVQFLLSPVANDDCEIFASGEPNRNDPDCHSAFGSGFNAVEAWDRAHPSP